MRLLVCGGRDYDNEAFLFAKLDQVLRAKGVSCIIHGAAKGADNLASKWAKSRGVKEEPYPADWNAHGKSAGPKRNRRMLDEGKPDGVAAFAGGKGTEHMVCIAHGAGVKVWDLRGMG